VTITVLYGVPTAHEATLPVLDRLRAEGCELAFNRAPRTTQRLMRFMRESMA
jgi:hypothetical protein